MCLNGAFEGDSTGTWTYQLATKTTNRLTGSQNSHLRQSVIDMCWMDNNSFSLYRNFCVGTQLPYSDHLPISITLCLSGNIPHLSFPHQASHIPHPSHAVLHRGFHLNRPTSRKLTDFIDGGEVQARIRSCFFPYTSTYHLESLASFFAHHLQSAASKVLDTKRPPKRTYPTQHEPWFDMECLSSRISFHTGQNSHFNRKTKAWIDERNDSILQLKHSNSNEFWQALKPQPPKVPPEYISLEVWLEYCQNLYSSPPSESYSVHASPIILPHSNKPPGYPLSP